MSEISVQTIRAHDTASVRHAVLWPSLPISDQLLPVDALSGTMHFGAFLSPIPTSTWTGPPRQPNLIGCLTITSEPYSHPEHLGQEAGLPQYQLRKFGVLAEYQGRGIGKELLLTALHMFRAIKMLRSVSIFVHFDARETQIGFYEKLGFRLLDSERFIKRGPMGEGPPVRYVRMGQVLDGRWKR